MIRLRQSLEAALRHPLVGPLLLLFLSVALAFTIFHAIEHGVAGDLFTCGILAAVTLSFVAITRRLPSRRCDFSPFAGRAPPPGSNRPTRAGPPAGFLLACPLRR